MPNFRYIAAYPLFYPAKRDDNGQSLMAEAGVIVQWDAAPGAAEWVETGEAATWPAAAPEPPQAPVAEPPAPVAPAAPVAPEAVSAPPEAIPVPVAEPAPAPVPPQPFGWLAGPSNPPARG